MLSGVIWRYFNLNLSLCCFNFFFVSLLCPLLFLPALLSFLQLLLHLLFYPLLSTVMPFSSANCSGGSSGLTSMKCSNSNPSSQNVLLEILQWRIDRQVFPVSPPITVQCSGRPQNLLPAETIALMYRLMGFLSFNLPSVKYCKSFLNLRFLFWHQLSWSWNVISALWITTITIIAHWILIAFHCCYAVSHSRFIHSLTYMERIKNILTISKTRLSELVWNKGRLQKINVNYAYSQSFARNLTQSLERREGTYKKQQTLFGLFISFFHCSDHFNILY